MTTEIGPDGTDHATKCKTVSSDITLLQAEGVPGISLNNTNGEYFWYHHTEAGKS